jgi:DNA-binding transcriptional MocR family regulator
MQAARARTLYAEVAARLADLVARGTFRVGDRVPSVRALSQQWQVSITTVLDAYRVLERDGVLAARPQSGYYVLPHSRVADIEPGLSQPAKGPSEVSVSELAMMMLRDSRDPRLLHLGAAVPDPAHLPTAAIARLTARLARSDASRFDDYGELAGLEALRVQIARRALTAGCAIAPGQVVVTAGCIEAVALCLRATCAPGDTVAIESPIYYGILQCIEALGLKVLEIPSHPRDGLSLEHLEQAIAAHAVRACVAITNFSNPSGSCAPDQAKRALVALLARHGIPLIEDDIYGDLAHRDQRPPVAKAFDRDGGVLLCSSFSKTISPGLRVGYVVAGRWQERIERLKLATSFSTAGLSQAVVAEYLASGAYDRHLRRLRAIYARNVVGLADAVVASFPEGTRVTRPDGGHVVWVELPRAIDALKLYELALGAGMTIAPGHLFSATQRYRNFIRLNAPSWSPAAKPLIVTLGSLAAKLARAKGRAS